MEFKVQKLRLAYVLVLTICICLPFIMNAQDFGSFEVNSESGGNYHTYVQGGISDYLWEFDWKSFSINDKTDGFIRSFYKTNDCNPPKLRMEGNIINGVRSGKWILHAEDDPCYFTGDFIQGKREGLWKGYCIYDAHDTVCMITQYFKNDSIDGTKTMFFRNGNYSKIATYLNGIKNGNEIIYDKVTNSDNVYVKSKATYKNGILEGERILFYVTGDTAEYEYFINGKRNGRCFYKQDNCYDRIINYNFDSLEGRYSHYYETGNIAFEIKCRHNLPYTVIASYDLKGNLLDPGTLRDGNGTLICHYGNGQIKSKFAYKNQLISGDFLHYDKSGNIV